MTKHEKKLMFFAYQGRADGCADDNVDSIKHAIREFNSHQKTFVAKSWEDYRKTTPISKEVLSAINNSEVFVCDLTYFNHNVLFELGYAIAGGKAILILINKNIVGVKQKYDEFILKNIRYTSITNSNSIQGALQQRNYQDDLLAKFINPGNIKEKDIDIFYKQSPLQNQASLDLTVAVNEFEDERACKVVTDDVSEVQYKPLNWYFQNLIRSKIVLIHMLGQNIERQFFDNAENSFYAGLACRFGAQVILVAPAKFHAPLGYDEILIQYRDSGNLVDSIIDWLDPRVKKIQEIIQVPTPVEEEHELNLIKLGIGCDIAEFEKEGLRNYFVLTASYNSALNQKKSVLIGRKGSGKSAIYIKLLDVFGEDSLNYVINLRPESEELLEDVEMSNLYTSSASKRGFFVTVWQLVIYLKLAEIIYNKLLEKPSYYNLSGEENALFKFMKEHISFAKLNFFGIVKEISKKTRDSVSIQSADILQDLYREYLGPLIRVIKDYFKSINAKYYKIIILADNLDKTWDSQHNLDTQSEMVLTLLELDNRLENELEDRAGTKVEVKEIIFLRKDIFSYVQKYAIEPDKLTTLSHEIDWEQYPKLLRRLIEKRFIYILSLTGEEEVEEKAWKEFFSISTSKKHPYDVIEQIITKRPRDLIYFIIRLFESAINSRHKKVESSDFEYAINNYVGFLNTNLIAETKAEFPEIQEILEKLHQYRGEKLKYNTYRSIVKDFGYNYRRIDQLTETLFSYDYMLGYDDKTDKPFSDMSVLKNKLTERRFFFLRNTVYVIAHAKYFQIKNKAISPF
ncbi:MAG TPA: hypothetical protein VMY06_05140 [Sedimentisphaerales bacterium]|nr:hypothetical protein [Sedimentisphaerales bacterium]